MKEITVRLPFEIGQEVWVKEHGKLMEKHGSHGCDYLRVPMKGIIKDVFLSIGETCNNGCEYNVAQDNGWLSKLKASEIYSSEEVCQECCDLYNKVFIYGTIKFDSEGYVYEC